MGSTLRSIAPRSSNVTSRNPTRPSVLELIGCSVERHVDEHLRQLGHDAIASHAQRLRARSASRRSKVMYSQMSVTMRPHPQYHSMYFGVPASTPASIVPKSSVRLSAASTTRTGHDDGDRAELVVYSHSQLKIDATDANRYNRIQPAESGPDRERHPLGWAHDACHVQDERGNEHLDGREHWALTIPSVCSSNAAEIAPRQSPSSSVYTMPRSAAAPRVEENEHRDEERPNDANREPPGFSPSCSRSADLRRNPLRRRRRSPRPAGHQEHQQHQHLRPRRRPWSVTTRHRRNEVLAHDLLAQCRVARIHRAATLTGAEPCPLFRPTRRLATSARARRDRDWRIGRATTPRGTRRAGSS